MGRPPAIIAFLAALVLATSAAASLQPIRRDFGELSLPRVRHGWIVVPKGHGSRTVQVVVRLSGPPLAAWEARRLAARGGQRRLNVRTLESRRHLAALVRRQALAAAEIERAIPGARVGRRFRLLLNGFTVSLPLGSVPRLRTLSVVTRVYPSLRYTLHLNRSPGVIGATAFSTAMGARGDGMKIAVVDDGVDPGSIFFDPTGFSYPPGFPRGQREFATPKVIVAKSFPAPGTPKRSHRAFDQGHSFHGTHVAGIAAGDAGTTAPPGSDHAQTPGLSGVAPRALIGNYRVFSLPTPAGDEANTPEIIAAFEAAVADGMDVINFSGGGAQTEPANDALVEVIRNVAAAGVVPVIAAGNDRDDFGDGTAGSPGTAPDAITVAAVSNEHVFAPTLSVDGFGEIAYQGAAGSLPPASWATASLPVVDVTSITGRGGRPVDPLLCAPGRDPNAERSTLPAGSLEGAVALVSRGLCTFTSKADRAKKAGAVGLVVVDNRPGEANAIPVEPDIPSVMIADLDGAALRAYLAGHGGRGLLRAFRAFHEVVTGRSGVVVSFSSSGPSAFGHELKPDVAAPGGAVLSSTSPAYGRGGFAAFDGTSMATPHVSGAAALLLERHPGWTPAEVKSALVSTAAPAWGNTARTSEAAVYLEGGGLIGVDRADDPKLFTEPASLSFGDLDASAGPVSRTLSLVLSDAGGGAGEWSVEVRPQSTAPGTAASAPATATVPGAITVTVKASGDATAGDAYGFVVLRREGVERRIPYLALVTRPGLRLAPATKLADFQSGTTKRGPSKASVYRFPTAPFGPPPRYVGPGTQEVGSERVYFVDVDRPAINMGVAVESEGPGALIDPFVLGSLDESDVQGMPGIPVNVNSLMDTYSFPNGAAGAEFPTVGRYYVSVDSGADIFTGVSNAGAFDLRAWIDDLAPPVVTLETQRVAGRRPLLAARIEDNGAGVDPLTIQLSYGDEIVGATSYDPVDGLALFPVPASAAALRPGKNKLVIQASDYQESKNVESVGKDIFPNTAFFRATVEVRPNEIALSWLDPKAGSCARGKVELLVSAGGPAKIARVRFLDGERVIGADTKGQDGLFSVAWQAGRAKKGKHVLAAIATDRSGREASATRVLRSCS